MQKNVEKHARFKKCEHFALLLCMLLLCVQNGIYAQNLNKKISITCVRESLSSALDRVERLSDYKMNFNYDELSRYKVTATIKQKTVPEAVDILLKGLPFKKLMNGNFISIQKEKVSLNINKPRQSYSRIVKGRVVDTDGNPIIGANIIERGTRNGVITNTDGRFLLKTSSEEGVLEIKFVGYVTQQVPYSGGHDVLVKLREDNKALSEVVVVGYGTAKKQSLTGAVSAIRGDELLTAPSTNVSSLLGGRLPGVSSVQTSGEPGDDQASLRIRGSIYGVTYIVDGMPRSINDIDPNDIESVSVLKDGASAAVYGLNSAGGVIIVTTKKGKEGKVKVMYDGQFGISKNANFPKFMNGPEFANYYNMADMMDKLASGAISSRDAYTPVFSNDDIAKMTNGDPTDGWDNVDYINKVFGTGFNMKHNVSLSGGTKTANYYLSMGYLDQKGNIDKFNYRRYNVRTNLEAKVGHGFDLSFGAVGTAGRSGKPGYASGGTDSDGSSEEGFLSIAHQAIMMHPYLPETYNGYYTSTLSNNTSLANSPLAAIYQSGWKRNRSFELQTNLNVRYDAPWLKGLYAKFSGSYDYLSSQSKNLDTMYQTYAMDITSKTWSLANDPRGYSSTKPNSLGEGEYSTEQMVGQFSVGYNHTFGDHHLETMALLEMRDWKCSDFAAYAKNLPVNELPELSLGSPADSPISGYSDHTRTAGYVFRVKYDYANKYLAEFAGRYDGSYKFNGNISSKRWGFFPSLSVGWRISSENFMKNLTWLDDLKLRTSIGLLGSDDISAYNYLSTYSFAGKRLINGTATSSMYSSSVPNPNLEWAKTRSSNVGFDATLWGGKLGMEFDVFYNYTYNILSSSEGDKAPSMGGYYTTYENYARTESKGYEILLTHRNKIQLAGKPLRLNVSLNLTYAKNRWLRYRDQPNEQEWRKVTGTSVNAEYVWISEGLYRTEDDITNSAWYSTRPNLGDIKYKDLNGDGVIDEQDKARIGRDNRPIYTAGLNLGGSWNGFDFNAQFTGGFKFDVSLTGTYYNGYDDNTVWTQTFKEGSNSPLFLVRKAWSLDNPNGSYPRLTLSQTGHGGDNGLASTFWFKKGDYVRLKSMQFGYTFPQSWMMFLGIEKIRLYVEGSNLFTLDNLPDGIDPESPRVNNGYYPQQKIWMGGVSITF